MIKKVTISEVVKVKKDSNAPYALYVENKSSNHLLIYFGSYNGEFRGDTTVKSLNCNGLFIRSHEATWYLETLPELGDTPLEVAETINDHILRNPHIKTVTLAGFSMGAWAALMYSTWVKANKTVVTVPQTVFPNFSVDGKIPQQPKGYWEQFNSISLIWKTFKEPSHKIIIQCCDTLDDSEEWKDSTEADMLSEFHCTTIIKHKCQGHKGIGSILLKDIPKYERAFLV